MTVEQSTDEYVLYRPSVAVAVERHCTPERGVGDALVREVDGPTGQPVHEESELDGRVVGQHDRGARSGTRVML